MVVDDVVIVEIKTIERFHDIHFAQLLSYLRLSNLEVGLLLNFWAETIRPLASVLCLVFVLMLAQAVLRGLDLNCGCFGAAGAGWFERPDVALVRATLLLAASLYVTAVPPPTSVARS